MKDRKLCLVSTQNQSGCGRRYCSSVVQPLLTSLLSRSLANETGAPDWCFVVARALAAPRGLLPVKNGAVIAERVKEKLTSTLF